MRKITLEEHFVPAEYADYVHEQQVQGGFTALQGDRLPPPIKAKLTDLDEGRLAEMDAHGIDVQVLSIYAPGVQMEADTAKATDIARRTNDYLAERISRHPDRLAGFATLALQDPKTAADELERTVTQLGFKGAMINGHTRGEYFDEERFWIVWERAEALGVPLYLHPTNPPADQVKIYDGYPGLLGATWNWTVETATHALRIVCSGIFDAFPNVTLLLGHMGEALPFMFQRIDGAWSHSRLPKKIRELPSYYIKKNIMITTSGNTSIEALLCSLLAVGADHILFSADYPFVSLEEAVRFIETAPISDIDREKICHRNAEQLLRL